MLAVTDNGIGMDEKTRNRIFEPFFTTKSEGKGTGLGLATVYGIVKQNEGHIFVYSEPNHGTTFRIYLPVSEKNDDPQYKSEAEEKVVGGNETVLLVEDEISVRAVTSRILSQAGYKVLESTDSFNAIHLAETYNGEIHLLLSDVVMPGLSGKDVAKAVCERRPDIRVLFISGYTANAIVHHGVLERETAFLQKPFSPDDLLKIVRKELNKKQTY